MQVRACFKLSFFTYIISHSIHIVNKQLKYILYIQYYFLCKLPPESFLCFSAEGVKLFGTQKASHLRRIYGMIKASGAFISVIEWPRIPAPDS